MSVEFDFTKAISKKKLRQFADLMQLMQESIDFKVSSRGWGYLMEQGGYINKSQFDKVENAINRCRKEGILPVDFVAEEKSREFTGIQVPSSGTVEDTLKWMLKNVLEGSRYFTPDWWEDEEYYIQMVVEKIDLLTLFEPVCAKYKIPIANAKGWQSILQRAEYARRFKEAEDMGLKCVLLYCGDHDPDGKRISFTMRKNIEDLKDIIWGDDEVGYDPSNLIIERFGLEYEFILNKNYTWIDNLITGGNKDLADPNHRNYNLEYVQKYLKEIGARKCEANVLVTTPSVGRELCDEAILKYLGDDAHERFALKRKKVEDDYALTLQKSNLADPIIKFLKP